MCRKACCASCRQIVIELTRGPRGPKARPALWDWHRDLERAAGGGMEWGDGQNRAGPVGSPDKEGSGDRIQP